MDWSWIPPAATVVAVIVAGVFSSRGVRAANKLEGQDQLNRNLQEDNEIQRRLTGDLA